MIVIALLFSNIFYLVLKVNNLKLSENLDGTCQGDSGKWSLVWCVRGEPGDKMGPEKLRTKKSQAAYSWSGPILHMLWMSILLASFFLILSTFLERYSVVFRFLQICGDYWSRKKAWLCCNIAKILVNSWPSGAGVSILMSYGENPHYVKLPIFSEFMENSTKFMKNSDLTKWTQNLR